MSWGFLDLYVVHFVDNGIKMNSKEQGMLVSYTKEKERGKEGGRRRKRRRKGEKGEEMMGERGNDAEQRVFF